MIKAGDEVIAAELTDAVTVLTDSVFQNMFAMLLIFGIICLIYILFLYVTDGSTYSYGTRMSLGETAKMSGWRGEKFNPNSYSGVSSAKLKKLRKLYLAEVRSKGRFEKNRNSESIENLGFYQDNDMEAIETYLAAIAEN